MDNYSTSDRVKDAVLGLVCWLVLTGLAAALHHAASMRMVP